MSPGLCFLTWLHAHTGQRPYVAKSGVQRESGVTPSSRQIHPSGLMRNTEQFLSLLGRSSGCLDWLYQWKSTWKPPAPALNATSSPYPTPTMEAGSIPTVRAEPGDSYPELQREACLFSKFSEVPRIFSGPNLKSKPFKNSKITCQT